METRLWYVPMTFNESGVAQIEAKTTDEVIDKLDMGDYDWDYSYDRSIEIDYDIDKWTSEPVIKPKEKSHDK